MESADLRRVFVGACIAPRPMGIAPVSPGVDLVILGCAIAFRQDRGKCGQISLDLYKITIRDLVPRCFERSLQLSPKRFELLLIHLRLLHNKVDEEVVPTMTTERPHRS